MKNVLYQLYKIKIWLLSIYYIFTHDGTYMGLYRYKDVFGSLKYVKIRKQIFDKAVKKLQKKKNKSIRIIMVSPTEWCTTDIYNYFYNQNIDTAVVISPFFHGTDSSIKKAYDLCRESCKAKSFRYIDAYDPNGWTLKVGKPSSLYGDIMLYTNPWMSSYPEELKITNLPLSLITCYIPYGFMLMKAEQHQFNQISHNMFTYIYCESKSHYQMFQDYCDIGNTHVEFSGHPKMDCYMRPHNIVEQALWKGTAQNPDITKIIYSPHWNFADGHATFLSNGIQILEYAETHPNTTSWIYKPHPLLEKQLISTGAMTSVQYREYLNRWEKLPNAKIYLSGDYGDLFLSSDCIINDSISFIAEYMYTHKPMLLLTNGTARFNSFGEECIKHVYTCNAKEFDLIVQFIENAKNGIDIKKKDREQFFNDHLNYHHENGTLASDYIISRISHMIKV